MIKQATKIGKKYIIAKHPLHSEPSQISMIEFFTKIVGGWKTMTVFAKRSPLGVCPGSEYISSLISLKCLFFSILLYTCPKSPIETPEQYVKLIQS